MSQPRRAHIRAYRWLADDGVIHFEGSGSHVTTAVVTCAYTSRVIASAYALARI